MAQQKTDLAQRQNAPHEQYRVPVFAQKHNISIADALKIIKAARGRRRVADHYAARMKQQMT